jgi:PAS domain S-box-containing protein/putative nucleotidyltransferase with HDIG domain
VTEKKRYDEALRESEEKYRELVNHAPAGIYEVDFIRKKFVTVNDVMCEYTGYSKEEILSMSPFDILTDESKALFMERMTKIFAGEQVPEAVEYTIKTKDGRIIWIILNHKLIYEKGFPKGARAVVHNITERKLAEQALRKSEERYRFLVDNANDAIFIAQDGMIRFPNPKTLEILGYSEDELVKIPYLDLVHPDDQGILSELRQKRESGKEVTNTYSLRVKNRSGEEIWAHIGFVPIVWEDRPATLNFVRDITIQKKAEEELRNSLDKLRKTTGATIQAMAQTVEVRDPYTAGHQKRVADLARAIATRMGLSADRVDGIRMAGVIHDIGKISVPAEILSKPGILTPLEFSFIKTHSQVGYDILKDIEFPWDIATMVLQHHERLDGSGYPQGVTGERILLEARILTVADVVEAMASHRPYRPSLGLDKALEEIEEKKGRLYDPEVVEACLQVFTENTFVFK